MFGVFQGNVFYSFFQNKKSDKWLPNTIKKMDLKDVKAFWYEGLKESPHHFSFDEEFNLVVLEEVFTPNPETGQDESSFEPSGVIYRSELYNG